MQESVGKMTNKGIVFTKKDTAELVELPMPEPKPGEVLVRLVRSTISSGTERLSTPPSTPSRRSDASRSSAAPATPTSGSTTTARSTGAAARLSAPIRMRDRTASRRRDGGRRATTRWRFCGFSPEAASRSPDSSTKCVVRRSAARCIRVLLKAGLSPSFNSTGRKQNESDVY